MKILVIGSEGFIGNNLINFFSKNNEVFGTDIINIEKNNYYNLSSLNTDYNNIFNSNIFDLCINASGNGSVPISLSNPLFDFELNTLNTIKILESIRIYNPDCKYINLSSAAVYGNPIALPINELQDLKPLSPYGWHKMYSENICKEYFNLYNIKTINLRIFSVYGENLKKQLFWDLYQKCLISKDEIELFGTGDETRDFIYIDDLILAIYKVIQNAEFIGNSINIASGIEIKIKEAARIFLNELNPKLNIKFNNKVKAGDPLNWRADISLLKSMGFNVEISIEQGLKNVVKWIKEKQ